jgi:hypothetical protein
MNNTITEKEFLATIYPINKFQHYIVGYPLFMHVNHSTNIYFMNKLVLNHQIIIWLLLLHEFDLTTLDNPGKKNVLANIISKFTNSTNQESLDDSFLDEHLFVVSLKTPWFSNIATILLQRNLFNIFITKSTIKLSKKVIRIIFDTK